MDGRKIFQELRPDVDLKDLIVHHIDGNRENNTPNNLIALTRKAYRHWLIFIMRVFIYKRTLKNLE